MTEAFTQQDIRALVATIRADFVDSFASREQLRALKPTTNLKDSDALTELDKLSRIIKAHATKVGIIYHPEKFHKNVTPAFKELQLFSNSIFFLLSLLPLFHTDKFADYFVDELDYSVLGLLSGVKGLCDEVDSLLDGKAASASGRDAPEAAEHDLRLVSVGKIWASCDSLQELAKSGNLGLLNKRVGASVRLITDSLSELDEWLQDPELESQDPFGLESEPESDAERDTSGDKEVLAEMVKFLETWQQKLKMIRLLLSSFSKSVSSDEYKSKEPLALQLAKLNTLHAVVVEKVDELISTVFMAGQEFDPEDEEILELISLLNDSLRKMVQIIKTLNRGDEKKGKWIEVWDAKYFA
ncbi:LAQU0S06e01486g1_1 [Lachancea quebecensis]|uniref:LAQU0S06e01486g1_1 n=1 Tax=Lachancea quebecensis TaxID=1654605 RepID=A0A0P1KS79_9SACH|nr:LAQU0S06e01486g1_1 [Lachancea quebecensis]